MKNTWNRGQVIQKECLAVLTVLYKKNGAASCGRSDFLSDWAFNHARTACMMECGRLVVMPGYPVGLDFVMGKYQ